MTKAGGTVTSFADADALLALSAGNPGIASQRSDFYSTINFRDDDGISESGQFASDAVFPDNHSGR